MKKLFVLSGVFLLLAAGVRAQSSNIVFPRGKIALFKAGDNTGIWPINSSKVQPCFIQVFDPVSSNQAAPIYSFTIPTNQPDGLWINAHAGSEGGGISRTTTRQFLALEGYTGNILSPAASKPSANANVYRGIITVDAFGNETPIYQDLANWFGLPPGVTQNNPTGIASTDGTNFWGTGNVTGTSTEAAGTLFLNLNESPTPLELQNYIQAAAEARIIGGTLYVVVPGQGVYNFLDPLNNYAVVPLPFDPDVPNPVEHVVLTNLFINWGSTFQNVANFDMNPQGTIAYGADETFGIVKMINTNGNWVQAPYYFNATNIGTTAQIPAGNGGCFGICVDFSSTNPVIYATTMENGQVPNSQGNPNNNRLIRIVDTGVDPGSNLVAVTLATAQTTNENFRGIDFTPDLFPQIDSEPANYATTNGGTAFFTVVADSVYPLSYQWASNGVPISPAQTNATLTLTSLDTSFNGITYQCVVSNQFGAVTSAPPALLTVTASPVAPTITNSAANVAEFVSGQVTFAPINPTGTQPFTYQWYHGTTQLVDDDVKYFGSTSNSLTILGLSGSDSGNYYLVAVNGAGVASNLVDVLTVTYHLPTIVGGEPVAVTTFVGDSASIVADQSGGSLPITNQWFFGSTKTTVTKVLSDVGDITGSQTSVITFNPVSLTNAGFYKIVVSNPAGSVTSAVAQLTVLVPPPLSSVSYSNQLYVQTFDSLPDPGSNSVNSINNPKDVGSINGVAYSLANPFDFAYPVINSSFVGGLGLSNTMPGWYGAADTTFPGVDGITRFGAQDGDQTTGGVIDFGPNDGPGIVGKNRALGLLSTSTTGSTTYALKLINTSGATLNYASLSFIGELWHNGTGTRTMSFGYTVDNTATNFVLTAQSISNSTYVPGLAFSFPTNTSVVATDGTQPQNQVDLGATNISVGTWSPGGALWLIWSINFYGAGSGNGYAIDNLNFYATASPVSTATSPLEVNNVSYTPAGGGHGSSAALSFTNAPGAFFTVYYATNLTPPVNWQQVGTPAETSHGSYSTYQISDTHATNGMRFYTVTSP